MKLDKEVYVLHITQNNSLTDIMNEDNAREMREFRFGFLPESKDVMKYLATFAFISEEERQKFYDHFKDKIDMEFEKEKAYIDEETYKKLEGK